MNTNHTDIISRIAFSPCEKYFATSSWDKTIRLWDITTEKQLLVFIGHMDKVNSVAFSPCGEYLTSASKDRTVRVWNTNTGKLLNTFLGHKHWVYDAIFSPDGNLLASCGYDNVIRLWNIKTGIEITQFIGHTNMVSSISFSPDATKLASCSWDNTIRLWDVTTGNLAFIKRIKTTNLGDILSIAFSPDGRYLARGASVSFSSNGGYLATLNSSILLDINTGKVYSFYSTGLTNIKITDIESKQIIHKFSSFTHSITFSPNKNYLAFSNNYSFTIILEKNFEGH